MTYSASVVRLARIGRPEVLKIEQSSINELAAGQVWLGINYLDVTHRNGAVPLRLPSGLGLEGAGRVAAIGPGVTNVKVGDRVAYATGPVGSYASGRVYPAERLVHLPSDLSPTDAASVLFKGITAQYLLKSTYPVGPKTVALIYGVAGGLGQLMTPWAKHLGAFVIGVVANGDGVAKASALGCDAAIVWGKDDLPKHVAEITKGKKVNVVYDPIGRATLEASLDSLRPRGLLVSFGASSGAPPPIEVGTLNAKGSLFLTRPSIAAHTADVAEYRERADDVLSALARGILKPSIWKTYPLAEVSKAHADLESGKSHGAVVLTT